MRPKRGKDGYDTYYYQANPSLSLKALRSNVSYICLLKWSTSDCAILRMNGFSLGRLMILFNLFVVNKGIVQCLYEGAVLSTIWGGKNLLFLVRAPLGIGERSLLELALSLSVPVASFELIPRLYSFLINALRTNRIVFLLSPKHHTLSFCFDKARINRSYAFFHTVDHANVFSNREATPPEALYQS